MNKYTKKRKILFSIKRIMLLLTFLAGIIFLLSSLVSTGANAIVKSNINALNKPVSILLMGGDDSETRQTLPLVDSIILLTINPHNERNNISVDALSIPRDTHVTYACSPNNSGKINQAFSLGYLENQDNKDGIKCMVNTVSQLLDTKIDYYAYTNFNGLVKIIDAIGGINIDVPYAFCEQDSNDAQQSVCLTPGPQTLNGEQALAYARQRKAINPLIGTSGDDWERNIRQQEIIAAIAKKILSNPKQYAIPLYTTIKNGAIEMNIDTITLTKLVNFGVSTFNNLTNTLSSQGNLNIILKTSDYNHKVAIDPNKNVFGINLIQTHKTLADLYPEAGDNIYYENTIANTIDFDYKNTTIPTIKKTDKVPSFNIELSMATIGTQNDDLHGTSDQYLSDEALAYYQAFIKQAKASN